MVHALNCTPSKTKHLSYNEILLKFIKISLFSPSGDIGDNSIESFPTLPVTCDIIKHIHTN